MSEPIDECDDELQNASNVAVPLSVDLLSEVIVPSPPMSRK